MKKVNFLNNLSHPFVSIELLFNDGEVTPQLK